MEISKAFTSKYMISWEPQRQLRSHLFYPCSYSTSPMHSIIGSTLHVIHSVDHRNSSLSKFIGPHFSCCCNGKLIENAVRLQQEAYVLHLISVTYFRQRRSLKVISLILLFFSIGLIIAHGTFENEFLRITCLFTTLAFTYYAYLHWFIRILAIIFNVMTVLIMEGYYFRELLLQLACYDIGKSQCKLANSLFYPSRSVHRW